MVSGWKGECSMADRQEWIERAKYDLEAMERLKHQYQPLVAARVMLHMGFWRPEYMEAGLEAFEEAVRSYEPGKGGFIGHLRGVLRHRLIDLRRREKLDKVVPTGSLSEAQHLHAVNAASVAAHREEMETQRRREEIEHFRAELEELGLTLQEVADSSPKHASTRAVCRRICRHMLNNRALLEKARMGRVPGRELSEALGISLKTIERHRKYLAACAIALGGDYHCIAGYILDGEGNA